MHKGFLMELTRTLAGIALFGTDSGLELISLEDLWIEMRLICQHTCVIFGIISPYKHKA